jgi:hypothetical protein
MDTTITRPSASARVHGALTFFCLLAAAGALAPARADDWLPVTPEELHMKSEPKAPAAAAIYLYRQVDRNDDDPVDVVYERIKVLTEEGRKYGNIEIPYIKYRESIRGIQARTIQPDGKVLDFDGTIYDKEVMKSRDVKIQVRALTLPDVQAGSIIEYRYHHLYPAGYVFNSSWVLSADLFTRYAKFSLKPYENYTLRTSWPVGLPPGTGQPKEQGGRIRLETHDVPAFEVEEYMPPADVMKYRVNFIYDDVKSAQTDFSLYWKVFGKRAYSNVHSFVNGHRALAKAVAQIVQPADSPETKLRKIYAHVQALRNLSYEREKSEQEEQREKLAEISDADDVVKYGYGNNLELTWLFLGLAREAGLEADALLLARRDRTFFNPAMMNSRELTSSAVAVKLDGRDLYMDPGVPNTPFGMLPWFETAVTGLRVDQDGGKWVVTPMGAPDASRVVRKAVLKLTTTGSLEGKVVATYTGQEAAVRRLAERDEDETDRRKFLESDLAGDVPVGTDVKLTNTPDWDGADSPLVAEYDFSVPGWAAVAARRMLLTVGLFGAGEKHVFEHNARVQPLYFRFPYQHTEEISIELPAGWRTSSLPGPRTSDFKDARYTATFQAMQGSLQLKREITMNLVLLSAKNYPAIRNFYQSVRAGDEDQIVVVPAVATASQ